MYFYLKAFHIIFVVTWFAGLFYIVRLFIYNTEANEKAEPERGILQNQFSVMIKRLWLGITWPSALLTLIFGIAVMLKNGWHHLLTAPAGRWLLYKLAFVLLLYIYHYSLHRIYLQQRQGIFKYSSQQLRIWNEVATVFLFAIVLLATVKTGISLAWALLIVAGLMVLLLAAIRIYKILRSR